MRIFPHDARYQTLIKLLRVLRKDKGMYQKEIAAKLDRPQSYVSKYETGERRLDPVELYMICEALDVPYTSFAKKYDGELKKKKGGAVN